MDTPQPAPLEINGKAVSLEILYEDNVLLVINKPAGIVVHPTSGNWSGTLFNALVDHFQKAEDSSPDNHGKTQPGIVHRLDKDTSGVMVVSKTDTAHRALATQFERHSVIRTYEALAYGVSKNDQGIIELAVGRDRNDSKKVSANSTNPQKATTEYRIKKQFGNVAFHVFLHPLTGRTHQLRVHMMSLGSPILGDKAYGDQKICKVDETNIPRVMLHARTLGFIHPTLGNYQEYTADLPSDMNTVYEALRCATQ